MGDKATLAKARRELEELYLGVPDESVNLTFEDLADVKQQQQQKRRSPSMDPISEASYSRTQQRSPPPNRTPSPTSNRPHAVDYTIRTHHHMHPSPYTTPGRDDVGFRHGTPHSSHVERSMASTTPFQERGGRWRPGIPHSNICTICSVYIYLFRHRCLVCGRVYCRQCVSMGMGEMTEGRKCLQCLGRRFSQRYIQRAGQIGWCIRYPSMVKQQELKWAEKGPRRNGERAYSRSTITTRSRSRSPVMSTTPATPTRSHAMSTTTTPPSFVINSPYSAHSPTNHPLPF